MTDRQKETHREGINKIIKCWLQLHQQIVYVGGSEVNKASVQP